MTLNNPRTPIGFVPEYQISAIPWVTSSTVSGIKRHRFSTLDEAQPFEDPDGTTFIRWDRVSKWVIIRNNSSGSMKAAFTRNGFNTAHYFKLEACESFSGDLRLSEIWLSGSAEQEYVVLAGLTGCEGPIQLSSSLGIIGVG